MTTAGLQVDPDRAEALRQASRDWPSWTLTPRQLADVELLGRGWLGALPGFLTSTELETVLAEGRLPDGALCPVPVTLDVDAALADAVSHGDRVALRDPEGTMLAALTVAEAFRPDPEALLAGLLGEVDPSRPEAVALRARTGPWCLGGPVEVVAPPTHHDLVEARAAAGQARSGPVVALPVRGVPTDPLLQRVAAEADRLDAAVLVHVPAGPVETVDLDRFARVRIAARVVERLAELGAEALLVASPQPARLLGAREVVSQGLVARGLGATHLVVGPDAAAPHAPTDAPSPQPAGAGAEALAAVADEVGVAPLALDRQVLCADDGAVSDAGDLDARDRLDVSDAGLAEALARDASLDERLVAPALQAALRREVPPRHRRGLTILLTGLSGSGKSTIASVLHARLAEAGDRTVTLLDGDLVRQHLSSELGFSRRDRDLNVRRIGYVASEITKHGGVAICAPIAPYADSRAAVREMVEATGGGMALVHVATPLAVCEQRDRKGLYAKARAGQITGFTGIDDPYEEPEDAELRIDTTDGTPQEAAAEILAHLRATGWWRPDAPDADAGR